MTIALSHRHGLEDFVVGFSDKPNPHHLAVLRRPVVFSVLAHAGHQADIDAALFEMADIAARFVGPGEWLLVSESIAPESLARDLAALGSHRASFVDQSDGRVVLRVSGPHVRKILAKCSGLDLHPDAFALGWSAATLCCHVPANLARIGEDDFEIAVMRSYAGMVFEELVEMGREFAMTTGFAD
ncbi:MAG: sarcosine oxidase subunit gamma [Allorhizobium sp.]